jgi:hypothetical protein
MGQPVEEMLEPASLKELYSPEHLVAVPLRALVALAARCARRVQPLWGDLDPERQAQLERALEIAEGVARGTRSTLDARRAEGVSVSEWSARRPDYAAWRTSSGAAIYALACACCDDPQEAAAAATLALRETHFAAAGDAADLGEAERRTENAFSALGDSPLHRIAIAVRRDFQRVRELAGDQGRGDEAPVSPEVFGPLWPDGTPTPWLS